MSWGRSSACVVAFEGIDGAGKTTLVNTLAREFQAIGCSVRVLHYGSLVRPSAWKAVANDAVNLQDLALLSYSRLLDWYADELRAAAQQCELLLLDRCKWSWFVRWASMGAPAQVLRTLCRQKTLLPDAHHTLYLDVEPAQAYARKRSQGQTSTLSGVGLRRPLLAAEQAQYLAFQGRARELYQTLCSSPRLGPVTLLDSAKGPDVVARRAGNTIKALLRQR